LPCAAGTPTTNGDGFGLGWYGERGGRPCRYRSITPAWSNVNLRELAANVESPLFLAHIRATTGTPVQETNCHPFRHRNWLLVHNSSAHMSRTLFVSADAAALRDLHPESERLQHLGDEDRAVVSEPLGNLPGAWIDIPESTALIVQPGPDEQRPFRPRVPAAVAV
jgi:hypothetical protein